MFNSKLLEPEIQKFIRNFNGAIHTLALSGSPFEAVSVRDLIQQIESRNRIQKKLPIWYRTENIIYPPTLNLEQTSSEITAKYKASLVSGKSLADITGGFGVDSYYFSKKFEKVDYFEWNEALAAMACHNFDQLEVTNISCHSGSGIEQVKDKKYDVIYADPSRRHESKGKVFFLKDCEPNIPIHLEHLLENCKTLLLKVSPMLDISIGLEELEHKVFEIHIVAVDNEVKELLFLLRKDFSDQPKIKTINITAEEEQRFNFEFNSGAPTTFSEPLNFLYEPNAAIMKSGGFAQLSESLNLPKLHKNSHLFTSESLSDFPGRRFKIQKVLPYQKSVLKKELNISKANITTRNFPESVDTIRKKWKIKDGGAIYLFFTTLLNEQKVVMVCEKV